MEILIAIQATAAVVTAIWVAFEIRANEKRGIVETVKVRI